MMEAAQLAKIFSEQGYVVIKNALSSDEVFQINQAIDRDRASNEWPICRGEGHSQDANIVMRMDDFDLTIENPKALSVIVEIMGDDVTFEEYSTMFRDPVDRVDAPVSWHRDFARKEGGPVEPTAVSLVYYLTDVSETDHCFSLATGTHLHHEPASSHDLSLEYDVIGPAGTAVIFHGSCVHTARLRVGSRQRRTLHLYYGLKGNPRLSKHTEIPERLRNKGGTDLAKNLYSKPHEG